MPKPRQMLANGWGIYQMDVSGHGAGLDWIERGAVGW
jgi:hypothetical protein